jgi:hypothetical protein
MDQSLYLPFLQGHKHDLIEARILRRRKLLRWDLDQVNRVEEIVTAFHWKMKTEKGCNHWKETLPLFNHLPYTWNLVYTCIVHHKHRVRKWPWLHLIQHTPYEIGKFMASESMINHFEMNDTIKRNCRKNRIAKEKLLR